MFHLKTPGNSAREFFMAPQQSSRNVVIEQREHGRSKRKKPLLGGIRRFAWQHISRDTNQGAVATVHTNRVFNQVELGPIFTGHPAVVSPVPVQHQFVRAGSGDDIAVRREGGMAGQGKCDVVIFFGNPSGARETVLGGVDGVAGALAGEVGHEEIDVGQVAVRVAVAAQQEIAGSQNLKSVLVQRDVSTGSRVVCRVIAGTRNRLVPGREE